MGRIGKEVAKKANGLGMNVIYHNRKPVTKNVERMLKAKFVSENTLYKNSDIISLHVPYNKDTHHLMNSKIFKKMKKTSFFDKTHLEEKIVDEKQLVNALKTKQILGAGIDVYELEPIKKDNPLLKLENVVLAPHVGSSTKETRQKMSDITVKNLILGLEGKEITLFSFNPTEINASSGLPLTQSVPTALSFWNSSVPSGIFPIFEVRRF